MSHAHFASTGVAETPVERGPSYATSAAYYVTRTTRRPLKEGEESPTATTAAAAAEAVRIQSETRKSGTGEEASPVDYELASKGAAASLRRPSDQVDMNPERFITPEEAQLSRAGSKAALRTIRDRRETLESEAVLEDIREKDRTSKMAATGAMATTHRRVDSGNVQEELPDLTNALSAASKSQQVVGEEQAVMQTVEPTFDPAKMHQVAVSKTQQNLAASFPPRGTQDETAKQDTLRAAAVTMAKQMYSLMPEAQEIAAAETSGGSNIRSQFIIGLDTGTHPKNLMLEAQKRVSLRLAQMDNEQQSTMIYHSARGSPRPPSITSFRRRLPSTSDAETSSFVRGAPRAPICTAHVREEANGVTRPPGDTALNGNLYMYSGRPSPAVLREWERKINEREMAVKAPPTWSFVPMTGTKFEDNPYVRDVARSKLQPTLDVIDDRVIERRARVIEKKLGKAHEKRYQKRQREREVETMKVHNMLLKLARKDGRSQTKKQGEDLHDEDRKKGKKKVHKAEKIPEKEDEGIDGVPADTHTAPRSRVDQDSALGPEMAAGPARKEEAEQVAPMEPVMQPNGTSRAAIPESTPQENVHQSGEPGLPGVVSQWSTSNDGEPARPVEPEQQTPIPPKQAKRTSNRFSLKTIFSRTTVRDTGKQGAFVVQKRTTAVARDGIENGASAAPMPAQPVVASLPEPQPGIVPRSSKFQEDL
ncbi:predicted protein [Uncinocarpus reesii 1704]|uniref:Uncharacterized protein n=1 Tax=Uncinocarpus reesii (strain UAMH 1704) TaxID=336963 RepID=C4JXR2_UNCRE|nr:uncharacterized protein UREG_07850 [Uncinocarpus reesii 1704]EEP82985.1 predicted protein [Uncinocarpus reesii 1704]